MNEKIEKYFLILYPEYKELPLAMQENLNSDKNLIRDHIDEIDEYYRECMSKGGRAETKGLTEQEIIQEVLNNIKIDRYFAMLYPQYETLSQNEKKGSGQDLILIEEYIDKIDEYYQDCMRKGSAAQYQGWTEQQIIQKIIARLKKLKITPYEVGKATKDVEVTLKRQAATIEGIKVVTKGEKVEYGK